MDGVGGALNARGVYRHGDSGESKGSRFKSGDKWTAGKNSKMEKEIKKPTSPFNKQDIQDICNAFAKLHQTRRGTKPKHTQLFSELAKKGPKDIDKKILECLRNASPTITEPIKKKLMGAITRVLNKWKSSNPTSGEVDKFMKGVGKGMRREAKMKRSSGVGQAASEMVDMGLNIPAAHKIVDGIDKQDAVGQKLEEQGALHELQVSAKQLARLEEQRYRDEIYRMQIGEAAAPAPATGEGTSQFRVPLNYKEDHFDGQLDDEFESGDEEEEAAEATGAGEAAPAPAKQAGSDILDVSDGVLEQLGDELELL
ncbi:hypothetical protein OAJ27_00385 [bacterium]|nr:hypothetical protein [bacterium]